MRSVFVRFELGRRISVELTAFFCTDKDFHLRLAECLANMHLPSHVPSEIAEGAKIVAALEAAVANALMHELFVKVN